eukprot:jgi/Mesvir1/10764/Mv13830-RA.1
MGVFIGKHGMDCLRRYKYSGVDKSLMAKYIFQPYWTYIVRFFPMWLAPNLITLIGFSFVLLSCGMAAWFSPNLREESPRIVYLLHAILLFLYQTFDAVDGKQARRTNSSSPLGELFDHGCDSLSCSFQTLALASTLMVAYDGSLRVIWLWFLGVTSFFFATWEHYHTGSLHLGIINGPNEGLFIIYTLHFITYFTGPLFWWAPFRDIPVLGALMPFIPEHVITMDVVLMIMTTVALIPTVYANYANVRHKIQKDKRSLTSAFLQTIPFFLLISMVFIWGLVSPTDIMRKHPFLLFMAAGISFGTMVGRMILANLCDEPLGMKTGMTLALFVLPLAISNALSAKLFADNRPLIPEIWMLVLYACYSAALHAHYCLGVIGEITTGLRIHCFSIKSQKS